MSDTSFVKRCVVALACALVLTACGGGEEEPEVEVPAGFTVPDGVELTDPDASLAIGDDATVVFSVDDRTHSAVTLRINRVRAGSISEFMDFSLDDAAGASQPYYVTVSIENHGPAGIGGAALNFYVDTGNDEIVPQTTITGVFDPCEDRVLPGELLPGDSAEVCLVYMVPRGEEPTGWVFVAGEGLRYTWAYEAPADDEDDED